MRRVDDFISTEIENDGFKMILSFGLCIFVACNANSLPVPCTTNVSRLIAHTQLPFYRPLELAKACKFVITSPPIVSRHRPLQKAPCGPLLPSLSFALLLNFIIKCRSPSPVSPRCYPNRHRQSLYNGLIHNSQA